MRAIHLYIFDDKSINVQWNWVRIDVSTFPIESWIIYITVYITGLDVYHYHKHYTVVEIDL